MLRSLKLIGQGLWRQQKTTKPLRMEGVADLELWSTRWSKGGRIVFEVALDYSENRKTWMEMLRLWVRHRHKLLIPSIRSTNAAYAEGDVATLAPAPDMLAPV